MIRIKPSTQEESRKYKIVRFYSKGPRRTIKTNYTLKEAQKHCQDRRTKKEGIYFDGYVSI